MSNNTSTKPLIPPLSGLSISSTGSNHNASNNHPKTESHQDTSHHHHSQSESKRPLNESDDSTEKLPTSDVLFRRIRTDFLERNSHDQGSNLQVPQAGTSSTNSQHVPPVSPRRSNLNAVDAKKRMVQMGALSQSSTAITSITHSIATPNMTDVLHCISAAVHYHLKNGHDSTNKKFFEIFDERQHPISKNENINYDQCPTVDEVHAFINKIFTVEKLPTEVAILGLAYMERLISLTNITIHVSNWRRVIMASLMLASKVWEDLAVWNVDFITVFPAVTVADLNSLESNLLYLLNFDAGMTRQYYAQYYFALRELAQEDLKRAFPLGELDSHKATKLEQNSSKTTQRLQQLVRTRSSESLPTPGHMHLGMST